MARIKYFALCMILCITLMGCSRKEVLEEVEEPSDSNKLTMVLTNANVTGWDPGVTDTSTSTDIVNLMFEGLTKRTESGWELGVAESYDVSSNEEGTEGTVYTFSLRKDARWSDGVRVKADDFEYAFKRVCDPEFVAESKDMFMLIKGAEEYAAGRAEAEAMQVRALDEATLVIELTAPAPYFMEILADTNFAPVRRDAAESGAGWETDVDRCISDGPYRLYEYMPGGYVMLAVNEYYYDRENICIPYVSCLMNNFYSTSTNKYRSGQVQIMANQLMYVSECKENRLPTKTLSVQYILFNTSIPPFDDVNVRNAFAHALDDDIMRAAGIAYRADTVIPPDLLLSDGSKAENAGIKGVEYDREAAVKFMESSAYAGRTETIDFLVNKSSEYLGDIIKNAVERTLNVDIAVRAVPDDEYKDAAKNGSFGMTIRSWGADYNDMTTVLNCFLEKSAWNLGHWENAEFERIMEEASLSSGSERDRLLIQAANIISEDAAAVPFNYYGSGYCVRSDLIENVRVDAMGKIMLAGATLNGERLSELSDQYGWPQCNDMRNVRETIDREGSFTDVGGNEFDSYVTGEHFEIYYSSDNAAGRVYASSALKTLEDSFDRVIEFIGVDKDDVPYTKVYMYDEYEGMRRYHIKDVRGNPDSMQGMTGTTIYDDAFIFILKDKGKEVDYKHTCIHEFAHIAMYALSNERKQAEWLQDGLANYISYGPDKYDAKTYEWLYYKGLPSLSHMENAGLDRYVYGYFMVEYIVENYGSECIPELVKTYGDVNLVLGITEDQFAAGWKNYTKGKMCAVD